MQTACESVSGGNDGAVPAMIPGLQGGGFPAGQTEGDRNFREHPQSTITGVHVCLCKYSTCRSFTPEAVQLPNLLVKCYALWARPATFVHSAGEPWRSVYIYIIIII